MENYRVLFVCSGPGVRGRIAEAFLNQHEGFEAHSAQFEGRDGSIPPFIHKLMKEIDLTMPPLFPKTVFDRHTNRERYDFVITLCHASTTVVCPVFRGNVDVMYAKNAKRLSWSIPDFRSLSKLVKEERWTKARAIRDNIQQQVDAFVESVKEWGPALQP